MVVLLQDRLGPDLGLIVEVNVSHVIAVHKFICCGAAMLMVHGSGCDLSLMVHCSGLHMGNCRSSKIPDSVLKCGHFRYFWRNSGGAEGFAGIFGPANRIQDSACIDRMNEYKFIPKNT
jgi:hypothetical protein